MTEPKVGIVVEGRARRELAETEADRPMDGTAPVAPRSTCSSCRAFNALAFECRRKAPVMVPVPQMDSMGQMRGFKSAGLYPATNKDQWCLEWVPEKVRANA